MTLRNKHAAVSDPNKFNTNSGDKFHVLREGRLQPDGTIRLVETGRENIQEKINSFAPGCDMSLIISRLRMGDSSVLTMKSPVYGDFTQFPTSYAECLDLVHRSEDAFKNLPIDVRQSFDNDINKWFATIGTEEWIRHMGLSNNSPAAESSEKVGED